MKSIGRTILEKEIFIEKFDMEWFGKTPDFVLDNFVLEVKVNLNNTAEKAAQQAKDVWIASGGVKTILIVSEKKVNHNLQSIKDLKAELLNLSPPAIFEIIDDVDELIRTIQ